MVRPSLIVALTAILLSASFHAQGPMRSYYMDPLTELAWASCEMFFEGGSRARLPFLPVVDATHAPMGTAGYTRDIDVSAPIVFVSDGVARGGGPDAYGDADVAGRVVLLGYDFAAAASEAVVSLEDRVREAALRGAAAVVLFSVRDEAPFPVFQESDRARIPEIPVIAINRQTAERLLAGGGVPPASTFDAWRRNGSVPPTALIGRLRLRVTGAFKSVDGPRFSFSFEPSISEDAAASVVGANDRSVTFLMSLFEGAGATWRKPRLTYFRDFDSKVFYTHHWGRGLSDDAGVFSVIDVAGGDYGLAVHENAHTMLGTSWGGTSSFMTEGFARYAESMASDRDRDHLASSRYLSQGGLHSLRDLTGIDIGGDPRTAVAYPAAGSFVAFLIERYGLDKARDVYRLEGRTDAARASDDTWGRALGKSLDALDAEWRTWLRQR